MRKYDLISALSEETARRVARNGQIELGAILNTVFSIHFSNVEFRKAEPQKYRLLQAADFICSMELLRIKKSENRLSKSEQRFSINHRN